MIATIHKTFLGIDDNGIFSAGLILVFDGTCQFFGGIALDKPINVGKRKAFDHAGEFIRRILQVVGAQSWEELTGRELRFETNRGKITRIGHLSRDEWLDIEDFLRDLK